MILLSVCRFLSSASAAWRSTLSSRSLLVSACSSCACACSHALLRQFSIRFISVSVKSSPCFASDTVDTDVSGAPGCSWPDTCTPDAPGCTRPDICTPVSDRQLAGSSSTVRSHCFRLSSYCPLAVLSSESAFCRCCSSAFCLCSASCIRVSSSFFRRHSSPAVPISSASFRCCASILSRTAPSASFILSSCLAAVSWTSGSAAQTSDCPLLLAITGISDSIAQISRCPPFLSVSCCSAASGSDIFTTPSSPSP